MAGEGSIALTAIPSNETLCLPFNNHKVTVASAPVDYDTIDVTDSLRDPSDFHGDPRVHDVVQFGKALGGLIGSFEDNPLFANRDELPENGIIILSDHYLEAGELVDEIDRLAQKIIADPRLYDDIKFCADYLAVARAGYGLLDRYLPEFETGGFRGIPVSLERAGLVTTRLALDRDKDAAIADEVRVVTKRAHPIDGDLDDLMVTVKWRDLDDTTRLDGQVVDIADFVNPASWSSTAAFLLSAQAREATPKTVVHRSFMATEQGISLSRQLLRSADMGCIQPVYYAVGSSRNLTPEYYLTNPAVADAGHVLRHFLPDWYEQ